MNLRSSIMTLLCFTLTACRADLFCQTDSVQGQIQNLHSPSVEIRTNAAQALGRYRDPRAISPLLDSLQDASPEVRMASMVSLGQFHDPRANAALVRALHDPDERLVRYDLVLFGNRFDASAIPVLIALLPSQPVAAEIVGRFGPAAVPPLTAAYSSEDATTRAAAVEALGNIADPATLPLLLNGLRDTNLKVRQAAVTAMAHFDSAPAQQALLAATQNPDPEMRRTAVWALKDAKGPEVIPALIQALQDSDSVVQFHGIEILQIRKDARGVQPLMGKLQSDNPSVRRAALEALIAIHDPRVSPVLTRLAQDKSQPELQLLAVRAMGGISYPPATPVLLALMNDPDPRLRSFAARSLGQLRATGAAQVLTDRVHQGDTIPEEFLALARMGSRATKPLTAALNDPAQCASAAAALGLAKDRSAEPDLLQILKTPPASPDNPLHGPAVVIGAAGAQGIVHLGSSSSGPLGPADRARSCFLPAVRALVSMDDPGVILPLTDLLTRQNTGRDRLPDVLARLGSGVIPPLVSLLDAPDTSTRFYAAQTLAKFPPDTVQVPLRKALQQQNVAVAAGAYTTYVAMGQPGSDALLIRALNEYGESTSMAEYLLNCGNPVLEQAARDWGRQHRLTLRETFYGVTWGSMLRTAHEPPGNPAARLRP